MTKPNKLRERLDKLRENFGIDVAILVKYYPIEQLGFRAFDNNEQGILNLMADEMLELFDTIVDKFNRAEEIVEKGKRYLVIDGEKLPFGYPYPDNKQKYAIDQIRQAIELWRTGK